MAQLPPRRPPRQDPRAAAEAAFRKKPAPLVAPEKPALPGVKEPVTLRIDQDILAHFQKDGPGWQDRMIAVLRREVETAAAIPVEDLNASNDE
jgi:uncharacterized protein (DUF4415 family)